MNSICSKNDRAEVEAILSAHGLWELFIFPSINWEPKAPRVKSIIESVGLRAPTVLFIDDNWQNLHQAADIIPGLNIAEPAILPQISAHPQVKGKTDKNRRRLKEYKDNEVRHEALVASGNSHIDFLRKSDIRVYFEHNVEKHLDRVIELINRTNQLNFMKKRLPEDLEEAKKALLPFLRHNGITPGLVKVVDRYGDYGFVGFYAMTDLARIHTLQHFCFSCRTLNMYIEHFVYSFLGSPKLEVVGDVLSDIMGSGLPKIDWIRALPIDQLESSQPNDILRFSRIYARGGCDLMALMHYFTLHSDNIVQELRVLP